MVADVLKNKNVFLLSGIMLSTRSQGLAPVLALLILLLSPPPCAPHSSRSVFQTCEEQYILLYRSHCSQRKSNFYSKCKFTSVSAYHWREILGTFSYGNTDYFYSNQLSNLGPGWLYLNLIQLGIISSFTFLKIFSPIFQSFLCSGAKQGIKRDKA